jgi:PAS domain S-box-containing protein
MEPSREAQFYQTVLRCVADGVFTVDCNWRITSFNNAAERATGVPAERTVGKKCSDVFRART